MNKKKVNYDVPQNTKDTVVRLWGFMKQQRIRLSIIEFPLSYTQLCRFIYRLKVLMLLILSGKAYRLLNRKEPHILSHGI